MEFIFNKENVFLVSKTQNESKSGKIYNRFALEVDDQVLTVNVDDNIYHSLNKHDLFNCTFHFRSGTFNGSHYEVLNIEKFEKVK